MENTCLKTFDVDSLHVDYQKKYDLCGLLRHFHEAAEAHAYSLGIDANTIWNNFGAIWIITRIRVEVTGELPVWQQEVAVETYPLSPGIVRMERESVFSSLGTPFAKLSSEWCMLDGNGGRPRRPAQTGYPIDMPHREGFVTSGFTKFDPEYSDNELAFSHTVRVSDLDMNVHMNNVAYIRLAVDAFRTEEISAHKLTSFEILFKSQSFEGETINVYRRSDGKGKNFVSGIKPNGTKIFDTIFMFE